MTRREDEDRNDDDDGSTRLCVLYLEVAVRVEGLGGKI